MADRVTLNDIEGMAANNSVRTHALGERLANIADHLNGRSNLVSKPEEEMSKMTSPLERVMSNLTVTDYMLTSMFSLVEDLEFALSVADPVGRSKVLGGEAAALSAAAQNRTR